MKGLAPRFSQREAENGTLKLNDRAQGVKPMHTRNSEPSG
jgi:hypothetical protein